MQNDNNFLDDLNHETSDHKIQPNGTQVGDILTPSRKDVVKSCTFESRVSQKTGKKYDCIAITLVNGYKKMVFLDQAESYMCNDLLKRI